MTRIILVRHGETNWNKEGRYQGQENTSLSERGVKQAQCVGDALKDTPIDVCISSPLERSFVTGETIAKHHNLIVQMDARLTEINHGVWEGQLAEDIAKNYATEFNNWHSSPHLVQMPGEGGEALEDVRIRVHEAFEEIIEKHEGKTILVTAHDAVNKVAICDILGLDMSHFWQIKQDNTCINVLEYDDKKWRLVLLNYTGHMGYIFSGIEQKGL